MLYTPRMPGMPGMLRALSGTLSRDTGGYEICGIFFGHYWVFSFQIFVDSFGILFWDSLLGFLIRSLQQMLGYFSSTFLEFLRFLRGYFWPSSEPFIVFARILGIPFPRILAFLSSLILYKKIIGANSIPKILPNLWDTRQITVRRYLENKKYSRFLTNPRPGNSWKQVVTWNDADSVRN